MSKMLLSFVVTALFQAQAWAQGAPAGPPENSFLLQLPVFIALFALFYFVLIRPQRQQAKKHNEFLASLNRGDEVILNGLIGRIVGLTEKIASVEIADGVEVKALRSQIQANAKNVLASDKA
jgi:preprotein translocase subunit YajC